MGDRTWPQLLGALLHGDELSTEDTAWAMAEIMTGSATPTQIAAFAVALRAKGETPAEVIGLVASMLANAVRVELPEEVRADAVDVVGTGGDRAHTVNISTMGAIVAAGLLLVQTSRIFRGAMDDAVGDCLALLVQLRNLFMFILRILMSSRR